MNLEIKFPNNIRTENILRQSRLPCLCKVSVRGFEVEFRSPMQTTIGVVKNWDRSAIESRVPSGAGGQYTYYSDALITLSMISNELFEIQQLALFDENFGWCNLIEDGKYSSVPNFFDADEDEII